MYNLDSRTDSFITVTRTKTVKYRGGKRWKKQSRHRTAERTKDDSELSTLTYKQERARGKQLQEKKKSHGVLLAL